MAPPTPVHVNIEQKQGDAINSTAIKHQYKVVADALCELHTHFNQYGAYELAKCVVSGMKHLRLPVADHVINFAVPDTIRATRHLRKTSIGRIARIVIPMESRSLKRRRCHPD